MRIPFTKMHGAGNDFVLVDDRELRFPWRQREWLSLIAARRTGIGCEGVVLLQPAEQADLRMRFFNPDGGEVEMCGNAARCTARFAYERGLAGREMRIATVAGTLQAEYLGEGRVCVEMTPPEQRRGAIELKLAERAYECYFVNTGVPHAVIEVDALSDLDVVGLGRQIRGHGEFAPAGCNVDFVAVREDGGLSIRTYERGVEDETLACGTGACASIVAAVMTGRADRHVVMDLLGGSLTLDWSPDDGHVYQEGTAQFVFDGEWLGE